MNEIHITSRVHIMLVDAHGRIVDERWTSNFLTELGEAYVADRLSDRDHADGATDFMAIGDGSGQSRTSTTLANEVARVGLDGGFPDQGSGADDNDVIWQATYPTSTPASDKTISEGALFSLTTGGVMVNYFEVQPPLFKPTTLSVIVQHIWTIGAS